MADWDTGQYLKFADERTRPAADLLARVPLDAPARVVDLGCGPGNSTALLSARFPRAAITGLDSSPAMLEEARRTLPALTFVEADLATWAPDVPPDLIFANAVLQWLPDHAALLPRLAGFLAPGGCLAVQVPDNLDEPSHRLMRAVAEEDPFREALSGAAGARTTLGTASRAPARVSSATNRLLISGLVMQTRPSPLSSTRKVNCRIARPLPHARLRSPRDARDGPAQGDNAERGHKLHRTQRKPDRLLVPKHSQ